MASGVFEQATLVEVASVLKDAVCKYGVPRTLVCDNGSQFTCSEFKHICQSINLEVDYAPKHYPRYKAKLERFFRTTKAEMEKGETIEKANCSHDDWINFYNHHRIHSGVIDFNGEEYCPFFRFTWKESLATPLSNDLDVDAVFEVYRANYGQNRKVNAQRQIRYRKQRYIFGQLNKGDVVKVSETKESISFYYQGQLLKTYQKPPQLKAGEIRKVKADGKVKFHNQYYQLQNVSKGTIVVITRVSDNLHFYVNGQLLLVAGGQLSVQQPI